MKKKVIILIIFIILAVFAYGAYYMNDNFQADKTAEKYINGTDEVSIMKTNNGLLLDGPGNESALIFYPGAKIEYTSYLPLLTQISSEGVDCFLVEMPMNLALFGVDSADEIINEYNYTNYFMSGHSLGGVMAARYVNETNNTNGLILLGAYSDKQINKPVLSVYATEDKVLNMQTYKENLPLISSNLSEVIIEGGNHAQMGNYGKQPKDGTAKISPQKQQKQTADEIIKFITKQEN